MDVDAVQVRKDVVTRGLAGFDDDDALSSSRKRQFANLQLQQPEHTTPTTHPSLLGVHHNTRLVSNPFPLLHCVSLL